MSAEPYLSRSGNDMSIPRLVLCHWWTNGQGTQIEARDTQADLLSLERIGKKTAESLLAEIEKSKTLPLNRLLFGLGIRFVGERTAQILAEEFGSMDVLMSASTEEFERVNEVGPRISQSIREFFDEERNRALIEKLRVAGLTPVAPTGVTLPPRTAARAAA